MPVLAASFWSASFFSNSMTAEGESSFAGLTAPVRWTREGEHYVGDVQINVPEPSGPYTVCDKVGDENICSKEPSYWSFFIPRTKKACSRPIHKCHTIIPGVKKEDQYPGYEKQIRLVPASFACRELVSSFLYGRRFTPVFQCFKCQPPRKTNLLCNF